MSEIVDRVAKALFKSRLPYLKEGGLHNRWYEDDRMRNEALSDARIAVDEIKKGNVLPAPANDAENTPPRGPVPLRFPLRPETLPSAQAAAGFDDARVQRGAVAGHSGWFWWGQVQPPNGVTIDYRRVTAMHITHRIPSSQSPVSLQGLMWKLAE